MEHYNSLNSYLRKAFGTKVYKISLSTPFTCPNRDGKVGVGGCIFCSGEGSGNFASKGKLPISQQLSQAKERVRKKAGLNPKYIAYFQSFTSTYGEISLQRKLFFEAISDPEVVALSIATRPDCLPQEVLDLLEELGKIKPVWVELGFQTAKEETAKRIGRGYENKFFTEAVRNLKERGVKVIVHLIVGLPGESHEDEIETLRFVSSHGIWGLKFHLLHVLRGTRLAQMEYVPLTFEEYRFRIADLLRHTPKNVVIHRITGDGDKKELIAPLWSADKKRVMNGLNSYFEEVNLVQGEKLEKIFEKSEKTT
jgi:radical SAM protein (TIGR01212 family)